MFLKRSEVPQSMVGRTSTECRLRISEAGQVVFNKLATEKLLKGANIGKADVKEIYLDFTDDRHLTFTLKLPKGMKFGEGFPASVKAGKDPKKAIEAVTFSGAGVFKHIGYDFVGSGSQTISATSENGSLKIHLPTSLTPQEKRPRKPNKSKEVEKEKVAEPIAETELALV